MKKRIVYITLTLSMLLGGYSFYEVKNSTSLLISENVEALSAPGDTPDEAIAIGSDYELVNMYRRDDTDKGTERKVYDNGSSPHNWADKNWYKDSSGNKARKCRINNYPSENVVIGHCFKEK